VPRILTVLTPTAQPTPIGVLKRSPPRRPGCHPRGDGATKAFIRGGRAATHGDGGACTTFTLTPPHRPAATTRLAALGPGATVSDLVLVLGNGNPRLAEVLERCSYLCDISADSARHWLTVTSACDLVRSRGA